MTLYSENEQMYFSREFDNSGSKIISDSVEEDWAIAASFEIEETPTFRLRPSESVDSGWATTAHGNLEDPDVIRNSFRHAYLPISRMLEPLRQEGMTRTSSADERFVRRVNQVWSRYSARSLAEVRDIQQLGLAEILAILFGGTSQGPYQGVVPSGDEQDTEAADAYRLVSEFLKAQRIYLPLGQRDFTVRYDESDQHRHVVTRIRSIMKQVDLVLAPQRELQSVIDEMYIGNKHLVLGGARGAGERRNIGVKIDDQAIPLHALSSGEKQLLQILLETLAVGNSTIMIDEPEISLHPDWQMGLVGSMRRVNSSGQFLLATHSPELMVGVADECVFEL